MRSFLFSIVLTGALVAPTLVAQEKKTETGTKPAAEVAVPAFPNANCPIMGKAASAKLYVDTSFGRIYVCCAGCNKKIRQDPETAYKTAYPKVTKIDNKICPVTGEVIEGDPVKVVLQGREINLCCNDCVVKARDESQIVLAKSANAKIKDLGNADCPITGKAVEKNQFVLIGDELVHLSSASCVDEVKKDPEGALKKAKASAAGTKAPTTDSKPADAKPTDSKSPPPKPDHGHGAERN